MYTNLEFQNYCKCLHKISGGRLVSGYDSELDPLCLGKLSSLELVEIGDKVYYHLDSSTHKTQTLVLCNTSEEPLKELQVKISISQPLCAFYRKYSFFQRRRVNIF